MLAAFTYMHSNKTIEYPKTWLTNTLCHKHNDRLRKKYRSPITVCLDEGYDISDEDDSGDYLTSEEAAKVTGKVPVGSIFVDGLGVGDVGNIVIRDRQHLAEDGILIVVVALDCENNVVVSGPDIVSRGFVYVRESDELLDGARDIVSDVLDDCIDRNISDWGRMKNAMKDSLNEYFWKKTKRRPMILPIIMEV